MDINDSLPTWSKDVVCDDAGLVLPLQDGHGVHGVLALLNEQLSAARNHGASLHLAAVHGRAEFAVVLAYGASLGPVGSAIASNGLA